MTTQFKEFISRLTILTVLIIVISFSSCGSGKIGNYEMEPLPDDLVFSVVKDETMEMADKNQLTIQLDRKVSIGQLATLADKYYSSKPKRGRFYIFYLLPGMEQGKGCWATSHFDPDLKIELTGIEPSMQFTPEQNKIAKEKAAIFDSIVDSIEKAQ